MGEIFQRDLARRAGAGSIARIGVRRFCRGNPARSCFIDRAAHMLRITIDNRIPPSPPSMPIASTPTHEDIIAATRHWLEKAVIGLNLCPFAKAVHAKRQIRYVVSDAEAVADLLPLLLEELRTLAAAEPAAIETTLLMHPKVLTDFADYNDFLDIADAAIDELGLTGEIQVASFHPDYQFAGTQPQDIDNYTNRAPYPTLHLLREESVTQAVEAFPDAADIFEKNIATLRAIDPEKLGDYGFHVGGKSPT
jgi:hypothetical protein